MKYLIKSTEVFRVDNEQEAKDFIEDQKKKYSVTKYSNEYREAKVKGEVVDAWYRVTLVKTYNEEKEPIESYHEYDNREED